MTLSFVCIAYLYVHSPLLSVQIQCRLDGLGRLSKADIVHCIVIMMMCCDIL